MRSLLCPVVALSIGVASMIGCALTEPGPRERQWREGDKIHYTDGVAYHVWVSTAYPHYHVRFGEYYETHEPSKLHFHKVHNPKGAPAYVRCFAEHRDGRWVHKPQWWELDVRFHDRRRRW